MKEELVTSMVQSGWTTSVNRSTIREANRKVKEKVERKEREKMSDVFSSYKNGYLKLTKVRFLGRVSSEDLIINKDQVRTFQMNVLMTCILKILKRN